jgi:hypothetical protein
MFAYAGPIIRSGESVSVEASQVLKGDFYGLGGVVTISGQAEDDAYLGGGTVTTNAPTGGDLTIVGGAVQVHGTVGDDLRVVGGDVTLGGVVKGDVVVVGGLLTVLSTATVEGDLIFMGGEVRVEGEVYGSIHGTADRARINSKVGGDISITTGTLVTLGDNAEILGNVTYESRNDLVRAQEARVSGDIRKVEVTPEVQSDFVQTYALGMVVLIFATLSLYFIARARVTRLVEISSEALGISGLVGLGILLAVPFVSGVLMVSVIGSLLGATLLILYGALLITSFIATGAVVGYHVQKLTTKRASVTLGTVSLGTALFSAFSFVPYVGGLLMLACFVVTLGGAGIAIYRTVRS